MRVVAVTASAALTWLSFPTPAWTQEEPSVVWYRSAVGCPDVSEFLALLGEQAALARSAQPGDRVDFVVTFTAGDGVISGRLERQTSAGTVAIRELHDRHCASVAGALALGLQIALQRREDSVSGRPSGTEPRRIAEPNHESVEATIDTEPKPPAVEVPNEAAPSWMEAPPPSTAPTDGHRLADSWVLVDATAGLGTVQLSQPGFVSEGSIASAYRWVAVRGGLIGSHSTRSTSVHSVSVGMVGWNVDACLRWAVNGRVEIWPCVGGEVGFLSARGEGEGGMRSSGSWTALDGTVMLRWFVSRRIGVIGSGGVVLPLSRYVLQTSDEEVARTGSVGARLTAGPFFVLR